MKSIYIFLFAIFFIFSSAHSQSNYKAGYVVSLKGDTTRGYINYKEWDNNPRSISFKKEINQGSPEIFTVKSVNAFAISGQVYYERYAVSVSTDPVDITSMTVKLDTSYKIDTVFLKVLTKGHYVNLYSLKDNIKPRFYLLENGQSQPYELIFHAFYRQDESSAIQYVKRFHTQLLNLMQKNEINNDQINRKISDGNYSETDLTAIVQSINGNTSAQFTPQNLFGVRWFAGAAVTYNSMKFNGNFLLSYAPASKNSTPRVSAGIDIFPNKTIQKFYFRSELSFSYGHYRFVHSDPTLTPSGTSGSVNISQYNTTITPQLIYNIYNKEQLKVFVDLGAAINFSSYNHYRYVVTYDIFPTKIEDRFPEFYNLWVAFPVKAGVALNRKFEVYFSYMPSTTNAVGNVPSIGDNSGFSVVHTSFFAGLNYFFGAK